MLAGQQGSCSRTASVQDGSWQSATQVLLATVAKGKMGWPFTYWHLKFSLFSCHWPKQIT